MVEEGLALVHQILGDGTHLGQVAEREERILVGGGGGVGKILALKIGYGVTEREKLKWIKIWLYTNLVVGWWALIQPLYRRGCS